MAASQQKPIYTVYIVSGTTKYNVTPALISLDRTEAEGQIAQRVTLELRDLQVNNVWLSSLLQAVNRVFVFTNDGDKNEEVFRGFLWERSLKSSISDKTLKVSAYDNLIYLQESEDSYYVSPRKSTEDIVSMICNDWGIQLEYSYENITNGKMALRGNLYDILTVDILDLTEWHTGKKYVLLSERDVMKVKLVGSNEIVYHFKAGNNVVSTASGWTMDGVVTQVVILGKTNADGYEPVELAVPRNTEKYGTLQKIYQRDEDTELWRARVDANTLLNERSEPKREYEINATDIPWVRKGDRIYVDAGDIKNTHLIVTAVRRIYDIKTAQMVLTLEDMPTGQQQVGMRDDW